MKGDPGSISSFVSELKRRKVVRTSLIYVMVCWGALLLVSLSMPASDLGANQVSQYFLYAATAGFPAIIILAWFFKLTTRGIETESSFVDRRKLKNLSPINERRQSRMSTYFHKGEKHRHFNWIVSAETGPLSGLSFGVEEPLLFGRSLDCDIAIVTPHVSLQHARLDFENKQLFIEDLGSLNGTMINGKPAAGRQALRHQDELKFHDIVFRVTEGFARPKMEH